MKRMTFALASACLAFAAPMASADVTHEGDLANIGSKGLAGLASRTVAVTMYDNYYEPEAIAVRPGETVRFVITNAGVAVHEFNIGTAAMHAGHQEEMEMMVDHGVIDFDVINHDLMQMEMVGDHGERHTMDHNDPNSVLIEPGDSAEIVWNFPLGGSLEFACNLPGHYDSGMMGPIVIQ